MGNTDCGRWRRIEFEGSGVEEGTTIDTFWRFLTHDGVHRRHPSRLFTLHEGRHFKVGEATNTGQVIAGSTEIGEGTLPVQELTMIR